MTHAVRSVGGAIAFDRHDKRDLSYLFLLCAWSLVCVMLLGGASQNVYLTNALVQLLTLPTLVAALWRLNECGLPRGARLALFLIGVGLFTVLLQLIPLPSSLWSVLPFREKAMTALAALGAGGHWAPVSMTPEETIVSALNLIAPLSLFLGVLSLDFRERRLLTLVALGFGFINAFVGLLQLSQGPESPLYFYKYTNVGSSVGLFANRNHEAALLYSLTPLAAAWIGGLVPAVSIRTRRGKVDTTAIVKLLAAAVTVFALIVATLIARSRAGILLLMFALLGGLALQPLRKFREGKSRAGGVFAIVAILAMMLGLQYGLYKILMRLEEDPFADARVTIARVTAEAALKALPFGAGLGSFRPLYASLQKPADLLLDTFVNAAHNDFLQVTLEAGLPGVLLILGFLVWFLLRCRQIWRVEGAWRGQFQKITTGESGDTSVDLLLARAATISIALLLVHSLVDYPLRTNALMGLFALCCALLVPPKGDEDIPETRGSYRGVTIQSGARIG
jgi:O-antigen ligase